jgi:hypothetical protein
MQPTTGQRYSTAPSSVALHLVNSGHDPITVPALLPIFNALHDYRCHRLLVFDVPQADVIHIAPVDPLQCPK